MAIEKKTRHQISNYLRVSLGFVITCVVLYITTGLSGVVRLLFWVFGLIIFVYVFHPVITMTYIFAIRYLPDKIILKNQKYSINNKSTHFFTIYEGMNTTNQLNAKNTPHKISLVFLVLLVLLFTTIFSIYSILIQEKYTDYSVSIDSPSPRQVVHFDKNNKFLTISGTSEGVVNNRRAYLTLLLRRVDTNSNVDDYIHSSSEGIGPSMPDRCYVQYGYNKYGSMRADISFIMYPNGDWQYRIPISHLYYSAHTFSDIDDIPKNLTITISSPSNDSNNISTEIEIVAIVLKQPNLDSLPSKIVDFFYWMFVYADFYGEEISMNEKISEAFSYASFYDIIDPFYFLDNPKIWEAPNDQFGLRLYAPAYSKNYPAASHVKIVPIIDTYNETVTTQGWGNWWWW